MATVSKWTPFGVALDITATGGTVTRTSATKFTVVINASWETYYDGAQTNYGMTATSGGVTKTISAFDGTKRSSGSGSFTGTYSITGNGGGTRTINVVFKNFNTDNDDTASKTVSFNVSVPAWTSYKIAYNANGGTGAPSSQTKWKDQTLTLSSTKPTRTGYSFLGWSTSSAATSATYAAGGSYTANSAATLYAVWKANTYTVKYNANGGTGAPGSQTKTYGQALTLSSTKPTRTNYTFMGWATSATATTAKYAAGASYTSNAAVTLYAVWKLSYTKPQISNLSASRCNSSGTTVDDGTYALIKFNWSTSIAISSISVTCVDTSGTAVGAYTISVTSGKSGSVSKVIGTGNFNIETSYTFTITINDGNTPVDRSVTVSGDELHIDFSKKAVAIGKPAETLYGANDVAFKAFDVKWRSKFRECVCIGDKTHYHDGKQGVFLSYEGFMQLQRSSAQGLHPYIGFYFDDDTVARGIIRLNSTTGEMEFLDANAYTFSDDLKFIANDSNIYGVDPDGAVKICFTPQNTSGNTIIGYGNYTANSGNTNIYGKDLTFGVKNANGGEGTTYRPYFRQGSTTTLNNTLCLTGFITNSGTQLYFTVPFAKPIVGSPTITVTSVNGFVLRQNDKYTHGSASGTWVKPDSYTATVVGNHGVGITATFSNTANCVNNAPIGIQWSGTITFS